MPDFTASWFFPLINVGKQLVLAVIICLVDVCESISIARALAQQNQYRLNPTQELRAIGFANLAGAFFNCYTTTGSFSRSGESSRGVDIKLLGKGVADKGVCNLAGTFFNWAVTPPAAGSPAMWC